MPTPRRRPRMVTRDWIMVEYGPCLENTEARSIVLADLYILAINQVDRTRRIEAN